MDERLEPLTTSLPPNRPLRIWPALTIVLLQYAMMLLPQLWAQLAFNQQSDGTDIRVEPEFLDNPQTVLNSKLLGPAIGSLLILSWWLTISRARWHFRIMMPLVYCGIAWVTWQFTHDSMVFAFFMFVIPFSTTSAVGAILIFRTKAQAKQMALATSVVAASFLISTQFRMNGVDGDLRSSFEWRWKRTDEQIFLSKLDSSVGEARLDRGIMADALDSAEFRGAKRDGTVRGENIRVDWPEVGLRELWRRRIGPGWSSFAVVDELVFTQEQRGELEVVTAYDSASGHEQWRNEYRNRFVEAISGVGPRATPTFSDGMVFSTGPGGTVQCVEANSGSLVWRRNLIEDTGARLPMWGFSSSPLVTRNSVIVFAGGVGKALICYDRAQGDIRWSSGTGSLSYSSPHLADLCGVTQVLMMTEIGLTSYDPETGAVLWEHEWYLGGGSARIVQPKVIENDILIGTGYGVGTRRISVVLKNGLWSTQERWTSKALKPYFNDFVVVGDAIYGFDKNIFTCVDLETGNRLWKRGRFGHGQVLHIEEQNLLLVLSESGDLVLIEADPRELVVLERFPALNGKTWNHPVIANGKLFIRNDVEAVCYEISKPSSPE